jgi:hypothetical protein
MFCSQEKVGEMLSVARTTDLLSGVLYAPALGPDRDSWVFLIKRVSLLLLSSISKHPRCVANALPMRLE